MSSFILGSISVPTKTSIMLTLYSVNLLMSTITNTIISVSFLLQYFKKNKTSNLDNIFNKITELDLNFTLKIIEKVIKEQNIEEINDSMKIALSGINEMLLTLNKDLTTIKEAVDYHNTKYFSSWRTISCDITIETIKLHGNLLKSRYKMFRDLVKLNN